MIKPPYGIYNSGQFIPPWGEKEINKTVYNGESINLGIFDKNGVDLYSIKSNNLPSILNRLSFDILYNKELYLDDDLYDINGNVFEVIDIAGSIYYSNVITIVIGKHEEINEDFYKQWWLNCAKSMFITYTPSGISWVDFS
jgi:hypothetical protein